MLTSDTAPALLALIEQVATTIRAPMPQVVAVDESFNAYTTAIGPRRKRVLCLGLPLWVRSNRRNGWRCSDTNWPTSSTATSAGVC